MHRTLPEVERALHAEIERTDEILADIARTAVSWTPQTAEAAATWEELLEWGVAIRIRLQTLHARLERIEGRL